MMREIIEVHDKADAAVKIYSGLTESQLRSEEGLFIAESPKVIKCALEAGLRPVSMLCEQRHISGDAAEIISLCPDMKIYTGKRDVLASITGYTLTRGVLCAFSRPQTPSAESICRKARRVAVIDGVCDTTNIGAIFRSAAALDIDAILLTAQSCDPLNRRAVRVSMGTVFKIPWAWIDHPVNTPASLGFTTVALALTDKSVSIADERLAVAQRLALILGTEGDGLSRNVIEGADFTARIPMSHGVDSLNVAAAAAVAFWQLRLPSRQNH